MRRPTEPPLTPDECVALWKATGRGWTGLRDRALLAVLWRCGLRAGEACAQLAKDVSDSRGKMRLRVSYPKGYQRGAPQRVIGVDKRAADAIRTWLTESKLDDLPEQRMFRDRWVTLRRPQVCISCKRDLVVEDSARYRAFKVESEFHSEYTCMDCARDFRMKAPDTPAPPAPPQELFITRTTGRPMDTSQLRRWLPMLAKRAGLERRVHPHCLRATFACDLYREGWGVREIQRSLGHRKLETTQVYLEAMGATGLVENGQRRDWI